MGARSTFRVSPDFRFRFIGHLEVASEFQKQSRTERRQGYTMLSSQPIITCCHRHRILKMVVSYRNLVCGRPDSGGGFLLIVFRFTELIDDGDSILKPHSSYHIRHEAVLQEHHLIPAGIGVIGIRRYLLSVRPGRKPGVPAREWVYYPESFEPLRMLGGRSGPNPLLHYQNDTNGGPIRLTDSTGEIQWARPF